MSLPEDLAATLELCDVLDRLGVAHLVGGSLASSLHGIPRATNDVDVVAALGLAQAEEFVASLAPHFYIDLEAVRDAIRHRSSFNAIHLDTMFKVDVFIPAEEPFAHEEMARRQRILVAGGPDRFVTVASPEDIVLQKLRWFQLGGAVSERQLADVEGVLQVQGDRLDRAYLHRWADSLGVRELLDRVERESAE